MDSATGVCLPQDNSATFLRPLPRGGVDSGTGSGHEIWVGHRWIAWHGYYTLNSTCITKS